MAEGEHGSNGSNGSIIHYLPVVKEGQQRPKVRADCLKGGINEARPCPWKDCRYNITESPPGKPTCALDVADEGGITLEEVGEMMGVTRERIRQIEAVALRKIRRKDETLYRHMLRTLMEN